MKRIALTALVFCFAAQIVFSQNTENSVATLDGVVKGVAAALNQRLGAEGQAKVAVSQFVFQDSAPSLSQYWNTQLTQELAAISGRSWTLLSGAAGGADLTVSGEIVEIVNTVRIYTRIIKARDHSIVLSIQSDFTRDAFIAEMLAGGGGSSSGGRSSIARDAYEPDGMSNPLPVEIGSSSSDARVYNRTIHSSNDEDFFLLTPEHDGSLTMETSGSMDTFMELYDENNRKVAENDDGGSGSNARIRQSVRAGSRYIAKVRGYSGETGSYGFFAYMTVEVRLSPDEFEPDNDFDSAKETTIDAPQQHTFHNGDDVDYVKFTVSRAGEYTIRVRGLNSNQLDTYIELFDSRQHSIAEDDDGGDNLDSRISRRLEPGTYYLRAECLDSNPDQPYVISITEN